MFTLYESPNTALKQELQEHLWVYQKQRLPSLPSESEDKEFIYSLRDEQGSLKAGISANCYWDGLEIYDLWVAEELRGTGVGAKLLKSAERYGVDHGAGIAFLKTVDAKEFYEKHGYVVYGELEDRPIGTVLFHMKKRL